MKSNIPVILLMGPTAAGKTAVAIEIAKCFPVDLISVDSALVYRHMNIGTAKPSPDILSQFPHALIDIIDPVKAYSAAQFCIDAQEKINKSLNNNRIPLLVGGTMLYFSSLIRGLNDLPTTDLDIRQKLMRQAEEIGWERMHELLNKIDPISAQRIHPHDPQRIGRALEIYEMTGKTLTQWHQNSEKQKLMHPTISLVVAPARREILHDSIQKRFLEMINDGFIEEVEYLKQLPGMHPQLPSMRAVGYRQVWNYLSGNDDYDTMIGKSIIATRQLAKRQLTWIKAWDNANWFDSLSGKTVDNIRLFLRNSLNIEESKN